MKLLVKHLGRIAHADLELRPLTVLIGENGTSKTWTAHSYFKLLERLRIDAHRPASSPEDPMFRVANDVAEAWQARIGATTGAVEFSVQRDELIERLPEVVSFSLQGDVWPSTLGARLRRNTRVELQLSRDELRSGVATQLDVTVRRAPLAVERSLILDGQPDPSTTTVYPSAEALGERLREAVEELLFGWRMHVRALPAERVNLAQLFPMLVRNKQVHMPRALVDFCHMMSLASAAPAQPTDPVLTEALARVAGGRSSFEERELMFHPLDASDVALPIRAAASLVKSVAGLDVFLSTAVRGDTLIIDEPEFRRIGALPRSGRAVGVPARDDRYGPLRVRPRSRDD